MHTLGTRNALLTRWLMSKLQTPQFGDVGSKRTIAYEPHLLLGTWLPRVRQTRRPSCELGLIHSVIDFWSSFLVVAILATFR